MKKLLLMLSKTKIQLAKELYSCSEDSIGKASRKPPTRKFVNMWSRESTCENIAPHPTYGWIPKKFLKHA